MQSNSCNNHFLIQTICAGLYVRHFGQVPRQESVILYGTKSPISLDSNSHFLKPYSKSNFSVETPFLVGAPLSFL